MKDVLDNEQGSYDIYVASKCPLDEIKPYVLRATQKSGISDEMNTFFSLYFEQNDVFKLTENSFSYGMMQGSLSKEGTSQYIGSASREKYRLFKISELEAELKILEQDKRLYIEIIEQEKEKQAKLFDEKNTMPNEVALHKSLADYQLANQLFDAYQIIVNDLMKNEEIIQKKLKDKLTEIQLLAHSLGILANKNQFELWSEELEKALRGSYELSGFHQQYLSENRILALNLQRKNDETMSLKILESEVYKLKDEIKYIESQMANKQEQLEAKGYHEIQKRIQTLNESLRLLPQKIAQGHMKIGSLNEKVIQYQKDIENHQIIQGRKQEQYTLYRDVLASEISLGYVIDKTTPVMKWAVSLKEKFKELQTKKEMDQLNIDLQTLVLNQRANLQEHNLTIQTILPCDVLDDISSRLDVQARYQGRQVNMFELNEALINDVELEKLLLLESDKELFEEILVNIIGQKIRKHIHSSMDWVKKMNRYMNEMNTSSGLVLNLKWDKRPGESEDELNTKDLITLLQSDPLLLNASDRMRLSNHFRALIEKARKTQQQTSNLLSFHTLMQQAMDYRQWFDFKILTQKTGEAKKELTNHLFFSYSGGEKAMSMYVPLFSAVAAKFESANEDAPLIIALDEAFAGVDERNIYNMFELIGKFKFDYIMNSQVLWGDYGCVKALNIYDLHRPDNAKFVTAIAYTWNGKEKRMSTSWN